jgi:hypothetical protein
MPRKAKPIKKGNMPTIALMTRGNEAPIVRLIKVYYLELSKYLVKDNHVSIVPNPIEISASSIFLIVLIK